MSEDPQYRLELTCQLQERKTGRRLEAGQTKKTAKTFFKEDSYVSYVLGCFVHVFACSLLFRLTWQVLIKTWLAPLFVCAFDCSMCTRW